MELVLILPVLILLPAGLLIGAAISHYLGAAFGWGLAVVLVALAAGLLGLAQFQDESDAIGNRVLALSIVAPLALGAAVGAWLVLRNRR